MIYSGLDWSGDPGDPAKSERSPFLVIVIVHLDGDHLGMLDAALARARRSRHLSPRFSFRYSGARPEVRSALFAEVGTVEWSAQALIIDKRAWGPAYLRGSRGRDRISDGIVTLVLRCADHLVAGQVLLIDAPREEISTINETRDVLRNALAGAGRRSFGKVKPRQDNRPDGGIVQLADMVAGVLHARERLDDPLLAPIRDRVTLVE